MVAWTAVPRVSHLVASSAVATVLKTAASSVVNLAMHLADWTAVQWAARTAGM